MVEHLLLDLLRAGDRLGRLPQLLDPAHQQLVELAAQRVVGVGAHLEQRPADAVHHPLVDPIVHEARHPPGALLADPLADQALVLGHETGQAVDQPVEQLLVAVVHGEEGQPVGEHRRDGPALERLDHAALEQGVHVVVADHRGGAPERPGRLAHDAAGVLGLVEPLGRAAAESGRPQLGAQDVGREEVVLDEVAQAPPDPVLPLRDDGGVGNRDVERVAEEGRDGEPVGHAADQAGLGGGADVAQPGMRRLQAPGGDEHEAHQHQQAGGAPLHAGQLDLLGLGVGDLRDRAHRPRRWCRRRRRAA
jgi:hypothetical protein